LSSAKREKKTTGARHIKKVVYFGGGDMRAWMVAALVVVNY